MREHVVTSARVTTMHPHYFDRMYLNNADVYGLVRPRARVLLTKSRKKQVSAAS